MKIQSYSQQFCVTGQYLELQSHWMTKMKLPDERSHSKNKSTTDNITVCPQQLPAEDRKEEENRGRKRESGNKK